MIAVLHNVRSLYNVGSVFRTADAAHAEKIYLSGYTPAPVDRSGLYRSQISKVALGAERTVPWVKRAKLSDVIRELRREGYFIFAVEQDPAAVPYNRKFSELAASRVRIEKVAFIFGNEVRGLSQSSRRLADGILEIPMRGATISDKNHPKNSGRNKESLNISVSVGIILFGFLAAQTIPENREIPAEGEDLRQ